VVWQQHDGNYKARVILRTTGHGPNLTQSPSSLPTKIVMLLS
jgi:hypothetical protein